MTDYTTQCGFLTVFYCNFVLHCLWLRVWPPQSFSHLEQLSSVRWISLIYPVSVYRFELC